MRLQILAAALALVSGPVWADNITKDSALSVSDAMDALEAAVTGAGATVFARVDHGAGAQSIEMELGDAELLIFGNPVLGTPAMQSDPRTGLVLPLKVLIYDNDGQTTILYEDVSDMFEAYDIDADAEFVGKMTGALNGLTNAALGG